MLKEIIWKFPLPRTHTGIALGNATTGLLVWGKNNHLKITVGRADFWDNRGGMHWTEKQNYQDIRKCLEANDETALRDIFKTVSEGVPGQPQRPSVVPVGRIDLFLPKGSVLKTGKLELKSAEALLYYELKGSEHKIKINLAMESQRFCIEFDGDEPVNVKTVPSWEFIGDYFTSVSMEPPIMLSSGGWIQELPENEGICIAYKQEGNTVYVLSERVGDVEKMKNEISGIMKTFADEGSTLLKESNKQWWDSYWNDVPEIEIPNQKLDMCYSYGLYKFAGLTNPSGTPATLQGPWIEEYEMPPWSSDYHFNINVQMCYWPAYKANRLSHLMPLFELVWSWREQLRKNAKALIGIDDGFMLPHAVDNKCTCMGSFWTGTIDHACAAWVAQMMFQYVQFSGDKKFLEETAYPFMKGTMRVFEEMLEKDGDKYFLPVSVSPEYRGAEMDAWGKSASFQLAAIHRLCEDLIFAAELLGEKPAAVWRAISDNLPEYTLTKDRTRIALWEGTDLEESHRHHSHLGLICPFDTIDIFDPSNVDIINNTIRHWTEKGPGLWSGWSVPWASMLHSRMHNGTMAEIYLEIFTRVYMNEGYGSLHDPDAPGFSDIRGPLPLAGGPGVKKTQTRELMQMDAAMGAVVAVQDMLLHRRRGVVYIFPGISARWENAKFKNMPCEGGFFISAELRDNELLPLKIKSESGGVLRLSNPWTDEKIKITGGDGEIILSGEVLDISMCRETEYLIYPLNKQHIF